MDGYLPMCKFYLITHKVNIKSFGLYLLCEWLGKIYTSVNTHPWSFNPIENIYGVKCYYVLVDNVVKV